jgi:hypothetical protein
MPGLRRHAPYDIFRSPSRDFETGASEHLGVIRTGSNVEAVQKALRKVACDPSAILWSDEGDVDDVDVIRLDQLEDRCGARAGTARDVLSCPESGDTERLNQSPLIMTPAGSSSAVGTRTGPRSPNEAKS